MNDAQLFAHMFDKYDESPADGALPLLQSGERTSLMYHAVSHTYEALQLLFHSPQEAAPKPKTEIEAVCQQDGRVPPLLKRIRKLWDDRTFLADQWNLSESGGSLRERFGMVRNYVVFHYGDYDQKDKAPKWQEYWETVRRHFRSTGRGPVMTGAIIAPSRYRHTFVDYGRLGWLMHVLPGFDEPYEEKSTRLQVAKFLDEVVELMNLLIPALLTRRVEEQEREPSDSGEPTAD